MSGPAARTGLDTVDQQLLAGLARGLTLNSAATGCHVAAATARRRGERAEFREALAAVKVMGPLRAVLQDLECCLDDAIDFEADPDFARLEDDTRGGLVQRFAATLGPVQEAILDIQQAMMGLIPNGKRFHATGGGYDDD
jgi:hypothetical protein